MEAKSMSLLIPFEKQQNSDYTYNLLFFRIFLRVNDCNESYGMNCEFPFLDAGIFIPVTAAKDNGLVMEQNRGYRERGNLELFDQNISDLVLELEGIKQKALRNNVEGIAEHIARMDSIFMEVMDAKLDLAEKCRTISN
jgi:hypothetical protein